jgi:hypothetical protein
MKTKYLETKIMLGLKTIAEELKNRKVNGIFDVEIAPDGYINAKLENRVDPSQPYTLTVHPIAIGSRLRVSIPLISAGPQEALFAGISISSTISLANGTLKADLKSGVTFELDHICQDDDGNDISSESFGRLIDGMLADFRRIETFILQGQNMVEVLMQIASNQSS